jgi:hypothetical protein
MYDEESRTPELVEHFRRIRWVVANEQFRLRSKEVRGRGSAPFLVSPLRRLVSVSANLTSTTVSQISLWPQCPQISLWIVCVERKMHNRKATKLASYRHIPCATVGSGQMGSSMHGSGVSRFVWTVRFLFLSSYIHFVHYFVTPIPVNLAASRSSDPRCWSFTKEKRDIAQANTDDICDIPVTLHCIVIAIRHTWKCAFTLAAYGLSWSNPSQCHRMCMVIGASAYRRPHYIMVGWHGTHYIMVSSLERWLSISWRTNTVRVSAHRSMDLFVNPFSYNRCGRHVAA